MMHLGMFGVKSAAPIVLPPQSCALGLGTIVDTVIPNAGAAPGEKPWKVSSCAVLWVVYLLWYNVCMTSFAVSLDQTSFYLPSSWHIYYFNVQVAPIMVATMSCDHRVVDGAVAAQWLSGFKQLVENPTTMLLWVKIFTMAEANTNYYSSRFALCKQFPANNFSQ